MRHTTDPKKASKLVTEILDNPQHPFHEQFKWVLLYQASRVLHQLDRHNELISKTQYWVPQANTAQPKRTAGISLLLGCACRELAQKRASYTILSDDDSYLFRAFFKLHSDMIEQIPNRPTETIKEGDVLWVFHKHFISAGPHGNTILLNRRYHRRTTNYCATAIDCFTTISVGTASLGKILGCDDSASKEAISQSEVIIKKHREFQAAQLA